LWSNENYTGGTACSHRYTTIVITSSVIFFPNNLELILTFFAADHFIHFFESLHQSAIVFLLFVQFRTLQLLNEDLLNVFGHLDTLILAELPPWPSNTPNIELPPPMSSSEMAASSIDLRQPN
jgi:hypothetical protein